MSPLTGNHLMAEQFDALTENHIEFIQQQHIFFVATAGAAGHVNVSPKGMDSFRVLDDRRVCWLNLTGSGNESAAHVRENRRMTIMFCSFDKQPLILRLYGEATAVHPGHPDWTRLYDHFPTHVGARQVFELALSLVQTSCGYAVPYMDYRGERPTLTKWSENKGEAGIRQYWDERNRLSLDGRDTGIFS
jgi:hypothetical protein